MLSFLFSIISGTWGQGCIAVNSLLSWQCKWAGPSCGRSSGQRQELTHGRQFFREAINAQSLVAASRTVVHPLGWRLLWPIGASGWGGVHWTTSRASYFHLLSSLCWHLPVLIRSLDSWASPPGVEGSRAEAFADDHESRRSKVIILWSSNCASGFQREMLGGSSLNMSCLLGEWLPSMDKICQSPWISFYLAVSGLP